MFGVALVGQHHISRGIEGRLVQYCIGGHKVGIDIQQFVITCQFQAALTSSTLLHLGIAQASLALLSTCATPAAVVVGIVAVVSVVHGGMHTAIFSPEEEAPGLEHFSRFGNTHLPEVSCFIPAQVEQSLILRILDSSGRMRLVGVAIANARFLIALLIVFNFIQRYSPPLTGVIAGGNEGVKPLGFKAVLPFGFMY